MVIEVTKNWIFKFCKNFQLSNTIDKKFYRPAFSVLNDKERNTTESWRKYHVKAQSPKGNPKITLEIFKSTEIFGTNIITPIQSQKPVHEGTQVKFSKIP